jgi:hypothetical protein
MASTSALNFRSQPRRRDGWKYWLTQVARLADVNDRAEPVLHQIDARFVRQDAQFFADGFSRRHTKNFNAKPPGRKEILR